MTRLNEKKVLLKFQTILANLIYMWEDPLHPYEECLLSFLSKTFLPVSLIGVSLTETKHGKNT